VASADYAVRRFAEDPGFISRVVRFDVPLLGDVAGLRGVHLQCHIGTDTVSLVRLGASMTGVDFSAPAVAAARELTGLAEHDSVPWNALPGMMTETDGEWRLSENPARLPCSFTIQAVKD
jgi:hypothetical protein